MTNEEQAAADTATEDTPESTPEAAEAGAKSADVAEGEGGEAGDELEPSADASEREQELLERLQRLSADYANYQKRVNRDKVKWSQEATRGLIRGLLPVLDTLDSAIAAFDGEVSDVGTYKQGVELVRDELMRQLGQHQLTKVHAEVGGDYDLDAHEAIMVQEADDVESKTVAFVARAGYRLGDTVLRPAQVGVKQPKA